MNIPVNRLLVLFCKRQTLAKAKSMGIAEGNIITAQTKPLTCHNGISMKSIQIFDMT
ncbi:MAG: hypothetical protein RIR39_2766 [Pseudomonadota bacterium]